MHTPTEQQQVVLQTLQSALGSALDNLPDVVADPTNFGPDAVALCCTDIAALRHLLAPDNGCVPNILAYLP